MEHQAAASPDSQRYYTGTYWNSYPRVVEYMQENFTGDRHKGWMQDFKERFGGTPFERGLALNCGNGWVERDFIDAGIVKHITAFDYSMDLLRLAKRDKGSRPISYFRTDINRVDFGENQFDLVINVAALHHVQYINRLSRILARAITDGGIMVSFDYIGPHRNQYPFRQWCLMNYVNRSLPASMRKAPVIKPYLPRRVFDDPTEAIHSELIIESVSRYFEIVERHDTGGGIAYELLTHNPRLQGVPADERDAQIDRILALDRRYTELGRVPPLFSYFLARPRKAALLDRAMVEHHQRAEDLREEKARRWGGVYSGPQYLAMLAHSCLVPLVRGGRKLAGHH